jgi:ubiquinone biosynthesis protein COQ4
MRCVNLIRKFSTSITRTETFKEEIHKNFIPTSTLQRTLLSFGSAAVSILDPHRGDMIACLGEVTGENALKYMKQKMLETPEGTEILRDMPRINTKEVSFKRLSELPENTVGRVYADFMRDNNITADSRLPVQFISDPELAYVMQRYREVHDLVHATLFMKTTMLGEVTIKEHFNDS